MSYLDRSYIICDPNMPKVSSHRVVRYLLRDQYRGLYISRFGDLVENEARIAGTV